MIPSKNSDTENVTNSAVKKSKKTTIWIIVAAVFLTLAGFIAINYRVASVYYYAMFKADHFEPGDKVYMSKSFYDLKEVNALAATRLVRPLTEADIDTMVTYSEKKEELRKTINPELKAYMCNFEIYFSKDDIKKNRSAALGTYVKTIYSVAKTNKNFEYFDMFYAIKPNRSVYHDDEAGYKFYTPKGYILADDLIYVSPAAAVNTELGNF